MPNLVKTQRIRSSTQLKHEFLSVIKCLLFSIVHWHNDPCFNSLHYVTKLPFPSTRKVRNDTSSNGEGHLVVLWIHSIPILWNFRVGLFIGWSLQISSGMIQQLETGFDWENEQPLFGCRCIAEKLEATTLFCNKECEHCISNYRGQCTYHASILSSIRFSRHPDYGTLKIRIKYSFIYYLDSPINMCLVIKPWNSRKGWSCFWSPPYQTTS